MQVLVTGGTGFLGPSVVDAIVAHGHDVTVLVHRRAPEPRPRVAAMRADILDPGLDLAGHDAVVHLVGLLRERGGETFERAHVEATRSLVAAAERARVRRFVHMSANGAREGGTRYQDTKARAERLVRGSTLDWTIFRPSFVVGEGPGFDDQWARIARTGPLPRFGKGDFLMQPVARDDLAEAIARALTEPKASRKAYDVGGPERFTFAEYERRLLDRMGIRRPIVPVPKAVGRATVALLQWIPAFPADEETLEMFFEGNVTDDDAWTRDLGIRPKTWRDATAFLAPKEG